MGVIYMLYDKARAVRAKEMYPPGTRIELISLCNDELGMPSGLQGMVVGVDDQPALLMEWDNGRGLSLLIGKDRFCKIQQPESQMAASDGLSL